MKKILLITLIFLVALSVTNGQTTGRGLVAVSGESKFNPETSFSNSPNRTVECDSLRYPLSGEIIYYYMLPPGVGYITGNNSYKDKAKAEYFASFEQGTSISGLIADFVIAKSVNNPQITFAIWDNSGINGKPGTIVASATKSLSSIVTDVTNENVTTVTFDQPFLVTGPFYAGVYLPTALGDTLALWCRKHVTGYNGTAWELWENSIWYAFNDPDSWGTNLQTTMTIHPIVCKPVGIPELTDPDVSIHPNPATGVVNITTWKGSENFDLEIISMSGQKVYTRSYPGSFTNFIIDLSFLQKGVYMIRLSDGKHQHNQKLILE